MRDTFVRTLIKKARKDDRIWVVSPDMGFSVFEDFIKEFPDRFINVGIAEQNAVNIASGLALSGKIPYVYSIIPFVTMRCFEQVRVNLAYMNTNVRLVGVGAGLTYGPAGTTHHAIEDISIMRSLPNMTVCCPCDPVETEKIVEQSIDYKGPMYIRLIKNREANIHADNKEITIGNPEILSEGDDLTIISTSSMVQTVVDISKELRPSINIKVVDIHTIKPIDKNAIVDLISNEKPLLVMEEHNIIGGLGSTIAEIVAESPYNPKFKRIGIEDLYTHHIGSQDFLKKQLKLDKNSLVQQIQDWI